MLSEAPSEQIICVHTHRAALQHESSRRRSGSGLIRCLELRRHRCGLFAPLEKHPDDDDDDDEGEGGVYVER